MFVQPIKLCEAAFSITPEALDTIDVAFTAGEFISAVIDTMMLGIAQIHQTVIAAHSIRMDDRLGTELARNCLA